MSKKRRVQIEKYWEISLGLKYSEEFEYYNRLCGKEYNHKLLKKNEKYDIDSNFLSYERWKWHVLDSIKNVDIQKLENYSRFLNQQVRSNEGIFSLSQTLYIPFIICLVSSVIGFAFNIFADSDTFEQSINKNLFPLCLLVLLWFIVHTFKEMMSVTERLSYKYFYQDIKEIVDERIEELRESKK